MKRHLSPESLIRAPNRGRHGLRRRCAEGCCTLASLWPAVCWAGPAVWGCRDGLARFASPCHGLSAHCPPLPLSLALEIHRGSPHPQPQLAQGGGACGHQIHSTGGLPPGWKVFSPPLTGCPHWRVACCYGTLFLPAAVSCL
jgi:hypothetical protein